MLAPPPRCVWPFIARHQLRQHISTIVYNLGGLYADIIGIYLGFGELANAVDGEARLDAREKSLRAALLRCRELLALTHNEPRLKAPFPTQSWTNIVNSIENLLNMLAILRCTANQITPDVIKELEHDALLSYRRDMVSFYNFSVDFSETRHNDVFRLLRQFLPLLLCSIVIILCR